VAASNQTRGGAVQTVLDVWDFAEEGEDWEGEPPARVYNETDSGGRRGSRIWLRARRAKHGRRHGAR
jgi:hypothetical protein